MPLEENRALNSPVRSEEDLFEEGKLSFEGGSCELLETTDRVKTKEQVEATKEEGGKGKGIVYG